MTSSPLTYSPAEAAKVAGIGRTSLYEAIGSGHLAARKFGRRTLILDRDLRAWIDAMPPVKVPAHSR